MVKTAQQKNCSLPLLPTVSASVHICVYHDALYGMLIYIYTTRINDNIYNMCLCVSENVTRHLGNMNALV